MGLQDLRRNGRGERGFDGDVWGGPTNMLMMSQIWMSIWEQAAITGESKKVI